MKFTYLSALLCTISGAYAQPQHVQCLRTRESKPILDVLSQTSTSIDNLHTAVKNWQCSPGPVLKASYSLMDILKSGTTCVAGSEALTHPQSLALLKPVEKIRKHAQDLVDGLKARKFQIQADFECALVRQIIVDLGVSSRALVYATVFKVPDSAKDIAKKQAETILSVLQDAEVSFNEKNCVDAWGK